MEELRHVFSDGQRIYDVERLWQLTAELPVYHLPVDTLVWYLDEPVWGDDKPLAPRSVINANCAAAPCGEMAKHAQRVRDAQLVYPILLTHPDCAPPSPSPWGDRTMLIVDGVHRLARAYLADEALIAARMVPAATMELALVHRPRRLCRRRQRVKSV